jgi:hypothetical protein
MSPFFSYDGGELLYQFQPVGVSLNERNAGCGGFLLAISMVCEYFGQLQAGQVYPTWVGG